jgi:hypothetical protein
MVSDVPVDVARWIFGRHARSRERQTKAANATRRKRRQTPRTITVNTRPLLNEPRHILRNEHRDGRSSADTTPTGDGLRLALMILC